MNTLHDWDINSAMDDGSVIVRIARKEHRCDGGHNGQTRTKCDKPIAPHSVYIEYTGESSPFTSGYRYHVYCAVQQGLLVPKQNLDAYKTDRMQAPAIMAEMEAE